MSAVVEVIKNEPVLITGAIGALIAVGAAFGLDLTGEQTGAIMAAAVAVLAVAARFFVTPTNKLAGRHVAGAPVAPPDGV